MKYFSTHSTPRLKTSAISKYIIYLKNTGPVVFCALATHQNSTSKVVESNCMNCRRYLQYRQLLIFHKTYGATFFHDPQFLKLLPINILVQLNTFNTHTRIHTHTHTHTTSCLFHISGCDITGSPR